MWVMRYSMVQYGTVEQNVSDRISLSNSGSIRLQHQTFNERIRRSHCRWRTSSSIYFYLFLTWEVSQHMGHPQIINFGRIFHDKPSISAWNQRRPIRRRVVFSGTLDRAGALRQDHRWSRGPLGRWGSGITHWSILDQAVFAIFWDPIFMDIQDLQVFFFHLKKSAIAIWCC